MLVLGRPREWQVAELAQEVLEQMDMVLEESRVSTISLTIQPHPLKRAPTTAQEAILAISNSRLIGNQSTMAHPIMDTAPPPPLAARDSLEALPNELHLRHIGFPKIWMMRTVEKPGRMLVRSHKLRPIVRVVWGLMMVRIGTSPVECSRYVRLIAIRLSQATLMSIQIPDCK